MKLRTISSSLVLVLGLQLLGTGTAVSQDSAQQQYFRYHRNVMPVQEKGEACSVVDPGMQLRR
jgi:hypothetical protein